ncbi:MAG: hypothetical protein K0U03_01460 [Betaproteobacteria bacterium]|jgi:hypothetical protein|nr:hypothetical protein [Betaproteobacteria bacterium]
MSRILVALFVMAFMNSAFADREFYGKIESMPENTFEGVWVIDGNSYTVTNDTEIDEEDGEAKIGACVEIEIDVGEKDAGAVEEIDVKKMSFLCSFYKFLD